MDKNPQVSLINCRALLSTYAVPIMVLFCLPIVNVQAEDRFYTITGPDGLPMNVPVKTSKRINSIDQKEKSALTKTTMKSIDPYKSSSALHDQVDKATTLNKQVNTSSKIASSSLFGRFKKSKASNNELPLSPPFTVPPTFDPAISEFPSTPSSQQGIHPAKPVTSNSSQTSLKSSVLPAFPITTSSTKIVSTTNQDGKKSQTIKKEELPLLSKTAVPTVARPEAKAISKSSVAEVQAEALSSVSVLTNKSVLTNSVFITEKAPPIIPPVSSEPIVKVSSVTSLSLPPKADAVKKIEIAQVNTKKANSDGTVEHYEFAREQYYDSEALEKSEFNPQQKKRFYQIPLGNGQNFSAGTSQLVERVSGVKLKSDVDKQAILNEPQTPVQVFKLTREQVLQILQDTHLTESDLSKPYAVKQLKSTALGLWPQAGEQPIDEMLELTQPITAITLRSYTSNARKNRYYWPLVILMDTHKKVIGGGILTPQLQKEDFVRRAGMAASVLLPSQTKYIGLMAVDDVPETQGYLLAPQGEISITALKTSSNLTASSKQ